jgi:hypothetical protein
VLAIALAEIFSKAAAFPRRCLPLATHVVPTLERHAPEPMKHSNPTSAEASLAISLPFTALSSSALSRRLPSQSEIRSGAFWRCNPVGSIPDRKLVRSDAYSKGFFHPCGLLFVMARLRKVRG